MTRDIQITIVELADCEPIAKYGFKLDTTTDPRVAAFESGRAVEERLITMLGETR